MNRSDNDLARTPRILVVEDDKHIAHMLEFMFHRASYEVLTAVNGRDAQAILKDSPCALALFPVQNITHFLG